MRQLIKLAFNYFIKVVKDYIYVCGIISTIMSIISIFNKEYLDTILLYKIHFFIIFSLAIIIKNIPNLVFTIKIKIPGVESNIIIKNGDILKSKNNIGISSSNLFNIDTNIISKNSLLGEIINNEFKNDTSLLELELTESLKKYRGKNVNVTH
jgi:hypothetical protein